MFRNAMILAAGVASVLGMSSSVLAGNGCSSGYRYSCRPSYSACYQPCYRPCYQPVYQPCYRPSYQPCYGYSVRQAPGFAFDEPGFDFDPRFAAPQRQRFAPNGPAFNGSSEPIITQRFSNPTPSFQPRSFTGSSVPSTNFNRPVSFPPNGGQLAQIPQNAGKPSIDTTPGGNPVQQFQLKAPTGNGSNQGVPPGRRR